MLGKKFFLVLILSISTLMACSKESTPQGATQPTNSSQQTVQTENKDDKQKNTNQTVSKNDSQENTNKNEIKAQDEPNKNSKTEAKAQDQSNKDNETEIKTQGEVNKNETKVPGEIYTNKKLGFSFLIPKSWSGKYTIKEKEEGIYVFFKPSIPAEEGYSGMLFSITKKTSPEDEDHLDTVGEPRTFVAKGVTYIVGGPTDVTFPSEHKEFGDFTRMQKEIRSVVKTIRSSN